MAKLTLTDIESGYLSVEAVNANNALIEAALENTLSRDGTTPNTMSADLDMNGYSLLNVTATSGGENFLYLNDWVTATAYAVNNLVSVLVSDDAVNGGAAYICLVAHTSGTFATDLAASKWRLLAARGATGATGAGSGDLVSTNNLSDVTDADTSRDNLTAQKDVHTTRGDITYEGASGPLRLAVGTNGQVLGSDGTDPVWTSGGFPSTTAMIFKQTAAPTGWTKVTTDTDAALRVTSGTISTGGTIGFTTAFANNAVGGTAISTTQMPSHSHTSGGVYALSGGAHTHTISPAQYVSGSSSGSSGSDAESYAGSTRMAADSGGAHIHSLTGSTAAAGSGATHTHSYQDLSVKYVDVIVATKD